MTCDQFIATLKKNPLLCPPAERLAMRAHVASCMFCQERVATLPESKSERVDAVVRAMNVIDAVHFLKESQ